MLRTATRQPEHWSEKVMSMLREQQLEACQERLSRCPSGHVFEDLPDDYVCPICCVGKDMFEQA